ncbi:unnamed protein product [Rotaria sp. Silwood2]|nr:unnamed protein product [Rotaria sp. Silwood2]
MINTCAATTKLIDKNLEFRPMCVRIQSIENLRNNKIDGLCTIEVKICEIGAEVPFTFEESDFKKVQKLKKTVVVGDKTGALELTLWEPYFHQVRLGESYQMKLVKSRLINSQITLSAVSDTYFLKIEDLRNVKTNVEASVSTTYISKGQIMKISTNPKQYRCQACGNDVIEQLNSFVCNVCQSRIAKHNTSINNLLKIVIVTDTHEEYVFIHFETYNHAIVECY